MKKRVIVFGLVMSSMMSAMDSGERAEGAAPLKISDEVAQMPDKPLRGSPKPKASPEVRAGVERYFSDLKTRHEQYKAKELAELKAEAEKINQ